MSEKNVDNFTLVACAVSKLQMYTKKGAPDVRGLFVKARIEALPKETEEECQLAVDRDYKCFQTEWTIPEYMVNFCRSVHRKSDNVYNLPARRAGVRQLGPRRPKP